MRRLIVFAALLLLAALAAGAWLAGSASGLQTAVQLAAGASGGRLQIEQASGRLLGPLAIGRLRWQTAELQVQVEQLQVDWSPAELWHGTLQIASLTAERLHVVSQPPDEAKPPPDELLLPLAVAIDHLGIARLDYGNLFSASELSSRLSSDGRRHIVHALRVRAADSELRGQATLDGAAPLPLTASAEISGRFAERPLELSLQATGPLERIALQLLARQGIDGSAEVVLTPFAPAAFASVHLALSNIDPAAWQAGAPSAKLSLSADLVPQDDGVAGHFAVTNPQPGPADRQRLPLASLTGQLAWHGQTASLSELTARFAGGGELTGGGRWQDGSLSLELRARQLDAARLVSTLHSTRLAGPVTASLAANRQTLAVDLKEPRFAVRAEASHAGPQISVPRFELSAGDARLTLAGELAVDDRLAFSASGEFSRFDPSRFARLPAAQLNASFTTRGTLQPRPLIDASFTLADSQLAGQPLRGQGRLSIDWPRISQADIALASGPNTLRAQGALGRPGDLLSLVIAAPELGPYGVDGGLAGRLELRGSLDQPQLTGHLQAARLALPGVASLAELSLEASAGRAPASPLHIELSIGRLATPDQPDLARQLRLQVDGSNQAHRVHASTDLPERSRLVLTADGGLGSDASGPWWRGRLTEARLSDPDPARNVVLAAPAALHLGAAAWSFGPAQLAGEPLDWRATVHASADARTLQASLSARGSRVGVIDGRLTAGMHGAWSLDRAAPWRGHLTSDIADLGWLAELIGDAWQSAGRLSGELSLSGTPAQPLTSGRWRGEKLVLRQPQQGLDLVNGELAIDLDANRLRIRRLHFDSLLRAMPRALRLSGRDLAALTRQPGRLEVSGEMTIDRHAGSDDAFVDIRIERLGAFQLPEQWILLSGNGRLSWNGETFAATGQLAVDAGYWQLAAAGVPRLSDDVVLRQTRDVAGSSRLRPKLELDLSTSLGRNFLFTGAGLSSRLSGDLRLRASGRDLPRASGRVRLRDGRFDAYGQQLSIDRGILTFQGLLDDPALDVRATRKGLAVEAGVQIGGTAQRPEIRLVSDPELPDAEKLAWLVLGHGSEAMGAGDATTLLAAAGGLLGKDSGGVVRQLKKTFGIDEFAVRQGELGGAGGRQPGSRIAGSSVDTTATTGSQILSIGKRLSTNALLSYEQALGRAEGLVKLTVNLNRRVSVVGRAGTDNALDIFYTLRFGRPADAPAGPAKRED